MVKNPVEEMQFQSLGQEDHLEKEMAPHSSILAWEIPWTEELDLATVHGVTKESEMKVLYKNLQNPNAETQRRQWHPTPALLPGKSHGWRSLVGCSPWGR